MWFTPLASTQRAWEGFEHRVIEKLSRWLIQDFRQSRRLSQEKTAKLFRVVGHSLWHTLPFWK